jgi:hypothetical protein
MVVLVSPLATKRLAELEGKNAISLELVYPIDMSLLH